MLVKLVIFQRRPWFWGAKFHQPKLPLEGNFTMRLLSCKTMLRFSSSQTVRWKPLICLFGLLEKNPSPNGGFFVMMTPLGCHLQDMLKVMSLPKHWFKSSSISYTKHDSGRGNYWINHTSDPVGWVASLRYHLWLLGVRRPEVCKDSFVLKELRSNVWATIQHTT